MHAGRLCLHNAPVSESEPVNDSLLQKIAAGDQGAVQQCIDTYGGLVWALARRWLRNTADAEDAVQEIFFDLWRSAARFDPACGSERLFISVLARRRLIDRLRKVRRDPVLESLDELGDFPNGLDEVAERSVEAQLAAQAFAQLSVEQQQVLSLSIVYGMSQTEIAGALKKPLGTVKTLMRRGLIKARQRYLSKERGA